MANRNTKAKRKLKKPETLGRTVNSSLERANSGRKPWRGAGDPLGRNR